MAVAGTGVVRVFTGLVIATYCLLVLGSSVRVHSAGLACPDWPLCFGMVVPELDLKVGLEYFHRVFAGLISLGFLGVGFRLLLSGSPRWSGKIRLLWCGALVVLVTQIILGGLTVLELLAEWTVTSHLVVGNTFCLLLLLLTLHTKESLRPMIRAGIGWGPRVVCSVLAVALFAQLAMGGLVASSEAGLACGPVWPECGGAGWFPTFSGAIGLQVQHRLLAYILLAAGFFVLIATWGIPRVGKMGLLVFLVICAQAGLGIANVLLSKPMEVTVVHSAGAALLVLVTTWLHFELWKAPFAFGSKDDKTAPLEREPQGNLT